MSIQFYNSLTRKKEPFKPLLPGKVLLYTCGPTVYDQAHIGNFRTFLFEDLLKRYLTWKGYDVTHVMNITDVDDKTIRKSLENQVSLETVTQKYAQLFFEDLHTLKLVPADVYPTATGHIDVMLEMIQKLMDKGHAYQASDGSIYFDIDSYPNYGQLAHLDSHGQRASERVQSDEYSKDNPQDFALWKSWKPEDGPVSWESPWGKGRPGWHIECSAMSCKHLGATFDIHGGGMDLKFPHHENEIAQARAATGGAFAKYWLHNGFVNINAEKMSKSLGNFFTIAEVLERYDPEVLRMFMLSTHYRSPLDYSDAALDEAKKGLDRLYETKRKLGKGRAGALPQRFVDAMNDDLNTPEAMAVLFETCRALNKASSDELIGAFYAMLQVFNLLNHEADVWFQGADTDTAAIQALVEARDAAKAAKDYARADQIRDELSAQGIVLEDTPEGTRWKKADSI